MSGRVKNRITPLCSWISIRNNILYDRLSVIYKISSYGGLVDRNSLANQLDLDREFSTTTQQAASTEAGVAGGYSSTDSTAEQQTREKRSTKKGKLVRRKPTSDHTKQKV